MLPRDRADDVLPAEHVHQRRIAGITKRRAMPRFVICDASMHVLFASADIAGMFTPELLQSLENQCRESKLSRTAGIVVSDDNTVLRIVPLDNQMFGCVAIFVDSYGKRGGVFEAAKKFGLTRRESEVLQLLLRAKSTGEIAETLCVAASTANDHIKSVMRKTNTTRRVEIVAKVFNLEHDIAESKTGDDRA